MLSALISTESVPGACRVACDLDHAGLRVLADVACTDLVQEAVRFEPDVIICFHSEPNPALFDVLASLAATAPRPVVVFTSDPDAGKMEAALRAGASAYVVDGYGRQRLRAIVQLARTRFRQNRALLDELTQVRQRFAERVLVDRAKGILMGARQLREAEAYALLRRTAMQSKQRLGQVAQTVIDSAQYAEAVNRAGLFRMISQRLVKLCALQCAGLPVPESAAAGAALAEENMAALRRVLSGPTFGDLLEAVAAAWLPLRAALAEPRLAELEAIDALAEAWLRHAERLTDNLEIAAFAPALHVVNVAGRQRMLLQKLAKEALLAALLGGAAAARRRRAMAAARRHFLQGMDYIAAIPLRTAAIDGERLAIEESCAAFAAALDAPDGVDRLGRIAGVSETLLAHFSRLTDLYEAGIYALLSESRPVARA